MSDQLLLDALPVRPQVPTGNDEAQLLYVCGLVERAIALNQAELARYPQTAVVEDFVCEEGWTVPRQTLRGVRVGRLLDAAGAAERGRWIEFSAGSFAFSLPIDHARSALVALALNESPLAREHGGPVRLIVPGSACFTSIKWLDRIEVREEQGENRAERLARLRLSRARQRSAARGSAVTCSLPARVSSSCRGRRRERPLSSPA